MQTKCGTCEKDCVCKYCQKSTECKYATREDCKRCVECGRYEPCYPFNRIFANDRLMSKLFRGNDEVREWLESEVKNND